MEIPTFIFFLFLSPVNTLMFAFSAPKTTALYRFNIVYQLFCISNIEEDTKTFNPYIMHTTIIFFP